MSLLHTQRFSSWARGHLLCRLDGVDDRYALTFDDGPNRRATEQLLDMLARLGARATFFLLASNVRRAPALVRRMRDEGHEPAVHGDRHLPLAMLPPWAIRTEILRCATEIEAACGLWPRHYRPPFGFMMPGQARFVRGLGFESVLGDVYPEDPAQPGAERIVARVMPRLRGGSVLILHDGSPFGDADRSQTLAATERIVTEAAAQGLRAITVAELFAGELPPRKVRRRREEVLVPEAGVEPARHSRDSGF